MFQTLSLIVQRPESYSTSCIENTKKKKLSNFRCFRHSHSAKARKLLNSMYRKHKKFTVYIMCRTQADRKAVFQTLSRADLLKFNASKKERMVCVCVCVLVGSMCTRVYHVCI